jgi:hypothetical protein
MEIAARTQLFAELIWSEDAKIADRQFLYKSLEFETEMFIF